MVLGPRPAFQEVTPYHEGTPAGGLASNSAPGPVRVRVSCNLPLMTLPVVPHDGTTGVHEVSAQSLELVPVHFCGVGHPTAQLLNCIHEIGTICRQIIGPGSYGPIFNGLYWVLGFIILSLFSAWFVLTWGNDPVSAGEVELLDDEVSVALIGLDLPAGRSTADDSVEESSFGTLPHAFAMGGGGRRAGGGPCNHLQPPGDGSRAYALSLDLESLLECVFEPSNFGAGTNCSEVVPVQESAEIPLAVVV